jgi:hypothetical protein
LTSKSTIFVIIRHYFVTFYAWVGACIAFDFLAFLAEKASCCQTRLDGVERFVRAI